MTAYMSSQRLLAWRILLPSTLLSLVSWFGECVAFYYVLRGLGVPGSFLLLQQSTFIFAASTLFGLVVLQFRPLMERLLALVARLPRGDKIAPRLMTAYSSSRELMSWRILFASTAISIVSWFGECIAFYYVLRGLGEPASYLLLLQATFVFAASTLFGLVSFLPGGLGVSEASSAGLLALLIPMAAAPATTATIIIRFCTLWFGVALGAIALAWFSRRYGDAAIRASICGGIEYNR
jgi:uncharacterized membrane protein YbhN (UPF0104 family)